MARRSLQASPEGIKKAKQAFLRKGWTQEYLASEVGIETRQPIWKFFAGKPVDRHVFIEICFRLEIEPEEIALLLQVEPLPTDKDITTPDSDINTLVSKVRQQRYDKIQDQCGSLRLLDITRPVELDDLYVHVNILEEITSQRWLELSDLQGFRPEEFDRLSLGKVRLEGVSGLNAVERYGKLMVLGKPGAGKTTFLQYIAVQCNQGHFQSHLVPIFIRLKNFAEDALDEDNFSLKHYISQEFERSNVSTLEVESLFTQGRNLLLLDGLDEVPESASDAVIKQIRKLGENYYKNPIIITCRLAAKDYRFSGFTEVEIADFKSEQIGSFAKKWFVAVARNSPESGLKKAALFLEQLELSQNQPIRELATTPILLNLTCLVFQAKAAFPLKRSDLYKQGLDLLLIRWDGARGIKRDEIYRNLSLPHKLQLLSQIAAITFEQEDYFFEKSTLQQLIADYLRELSSDHIDLATLELDSAAILQSIEAQHGLLVERARLIYSFSHLTFQEYFTARAIVAGADASLPKLVQHLTEKRWREVILLTAQILPDADRLLQLMKQQIDAVAIVDVEDGSGSLSNNANQTLPQLLDWVRQKSLAVKTSYKPAAVRAFYLTLALPPDYPLAGNQALALAIDCNLAGEVGGELALDLALIHALTVAVTLTPELASDRLSALRLALDLNHLTGSKPISASLRQLQHQLPNPDEDQDSIKQWWQVNSQAWISQLRAIAIAHRHIGYEWHLSQAWQQRFEQYNYGNQLLVECLNSNCQVTPTVRQELEEMLLLPLSEL
ncbi:MULTISPECIES: NACHT domain-containing protein [unclassified Coleofasciculus]|uniref:NACHT domain-containing protein n=1 Tax=unclassified Coleofasciculus TaxID=2692782 RepID=UPI00187ED0A9|nr:MULTISPECIES: NACHT domain-containing NTPase [unclassified Coleofasciculus]MBE9125469.1 NACHT domain-containing NTPase [Coleofasciculus sp. LEGE 07081]MBE9147440.1 NACHT domain-containing NTPase [Coleofasciculus sp. LEGE 07092]